LLRLFEPLDAGAWRRTPHHVVMVGIRS
jgi:hypothetical protein